LAWSIVVGGVASKSIDGNMRITQPSGLVVYTSHGNVGGLTGVLLFAVALTCAVYALTTSRGRVSVDTAFATLMLSLIAWWAVCSLVLRRDPLDRQQAFFIAGGTIIAAAVAVSPPTMQTLRSLNLVRDVSVVLMLLVSVTDPTGSQLLCRPDKCGIFGSLYTGFFYTENSAAQFILLMVPAAIAIRSRIRLVLSLTLSAIFILATGSRTSLLDFVIVVLFLLTYHHNILTDQVRRISRVWRSIPIATFLASMFVFLMFSGSQLTGRGTIYAGIRSQLHGYSLIVGSGPDTMVRIFEDGLLGNFEAIGEHGQVPHVLVEAGVLGVVLFGCALLSLLVDNRPWSPEQIASLALTLAAALQFVTEPGWTLDARSIDFVTMLFAIGLYRRGSIGSVGYLQTNESRPADWLSVNRSN
jgi:hypothetical protein